MQPFPFGFLTRETNITQTSCFFSSNNVLGAENQLSNRTYFAVMSAHCAEWMSVSE